MKYNFQLTAHEIAIILVALNAKYEDEIFYETLNLGHEDEELESDVQGSNDYLRVYEKILSLTRWCG